MRSILMLLLLFAGPYSNAKAVKAYYSESCVNREEPHEEIVRTDYYTTSDPMGGVYSNNLLSYIVAEGVRGVVWLEPNLDGDKVWFSGSGGFLPSQDYSLQLKPDKKIIIYKHGPVGTSKIEYLLDCHEIED